MTSRSHEYTYNDTGPLKSLLTLVFLIFVAVVLVAAYLLLRQDGVDVQTRDHAVIAHGAEATNIRRCLDSNGPQETWKITGHKKPNHFVFTCKMDDGRFGIQIAQKTKAGQWIEKTAFVVKDGTGRQLLEYLTARAVQFLGDL